MPLLEGLDGVNKMSKSLGNYIGINEPPDEIFGKIMSVSDDLMLRYYELLSDLSLIELEKLRTALKSGEVHPMEAKKTLGREVVERYHGYSAALTAEENFVKRFKENQVLSRWSALTWPLKAAKALLCKVLAEAGLVKSNSEGAGQFNREWGQGKQRKGFG
jgi:tyrosyl-tRNA synthetase